MAKLAGGAGVDAGTSAPEKERRYIYNGAPAGGSSGFALRSNRKAVRRTVSTFNIIILLFGIGGAIVLYINNIITINRLSGEVHELQVRFDALVNSNAALRAEVNRKSAWERISVIASEQLGLRPAKHQPAWFTVDRDRAQELLEQSPPVQ